MTTVLVLILLAWSGGPLRGEDVADAPLGRRDLTGLGRPADMPVPAGPASQAGRRSVRRRSRGGAIGGVGGFFAGGYLGARIDGPCDCDDPGSVGFLIGAPTGAAAGTVLGALFL